MNWGERNRRTIIDLKVDIISRQLAIDTIVSKAKSGELGYVCFANVHMTIEAHLFPDFAATVNNASLVLADGMPLVAWLRIFFKIGQERLAGMDLFSDLISEASDKNLKIFFFGSDQLTLNRIVEKARGKFPKIEIAGTLSPPFDQPINDPYYISVINDSGAGLVFVSLGCPKQEKWMAKHSCNINAILLGVGGAFPVYAGVVKRAPVVMQKMGLEWFYRLAQEPSRLLSRYFKTNSMFIYILIKTKVKMLLKKENTSQ